MKNKLTLLVLAFVVNFSFINAADCQPMTDDACFPLPYEETYAPQCKWGVRDAYRYVSVGTGPIFLIPNLGIGYRQRYSHLGWDTALSFSTIGYAHQLSAHVVGHYYLNPCQQNSAYLGFGLLGSGIFTNHHGAGGTLSTDFVIGKELERDGCKRHFIEMHAAVPTVWMNSKHSHSMYLPLMYVKYGISF